MAGRKSHGSWRPGRDRKCDTRELDELLYNLTHFKANPKQCQVLEDAAYIEELLSYIEALEVATGEGSSPSAGSEAERIPNLNVLHDLLLKDLAKCP
jgi:hypothetical protein